MNIDLPIVQTTLGPTWANMLNIAIGTVIDQHDHSTGKGVKVTPAGLNINQDLSFAINNATNLRSTRFNSATTPFSQVADANCVYVVNGELYYRDAAGNNIQLTSNGGINISSTGTIGGDYGQPGVLASVTYSDSTKTFSFTRSSAVGADIICSSIKVADPSVGAQAITIQANSSAIAYSIILPDTITATNQSLVTIDTSGQLNYTTELTANLTIGGNIQYLGGNTISGDIIRSGTTTGGTYDNITLTNSTLSSNTFSGTNTNSGTISGGTISGATLSGTITNSGTISGGTLSGSTLTGTITNSGTISGGTLSANTISNSTLSGTITTPLTASRVVFTDGSSRLTTNTLTGTGSVVQDTNATLNTPTLQSPTIINGTATGLAMTDISISGTVSTLFGTLTNTGTINNTSGTISGGTISATTLGASGTTTLSGTLAVNSSTLSTNQTTFNLVNTTATTVNLAGAATALTIGATTGTATLRNATVTASGDFNVVGNGRGIVPLGAIIPMTTGLTGAMAVPTSGSVSNGWMRADGSTIPGGNSVSGTTPNLSTSIYLRGFTTYGATGGSNTTTLTTTELPAHTHTIDHGHGNSFALGGTTTFASSGHTHIMAHTHQWGRRATGGIFSTTGSDPNNTSVFNQVVVNRSADVASGGTYAAVFTDFSTQVFYTAGVYAGGNGASGSGNNAATAGPSGTGTVTFSGSVTNVSGTNSGSSGAGSSFTNEPNYINVIYLIRVN